MISGSMALRSSRLFSVNPSRSVGWQPASFPWRLPIAVRTVSTMTAARTGGIPDMVVRVTVEETGGDAPSRADVLAHLRRFLGPSPGPLTLAGAVEVHAFGP